ncbi:MULTISPECIES: alpha/beta fold hydrolase [unclassified Nocardiopsis]|uniref:alpha/beta fold hydrolase n=1 Tax=unclassified Nocardiopsis TaxID=2649073 RepID=UPI001356AF45|nr:MULTISPECIES: alpha/beta fold hydrolase [unclassified Nocardiopsis]
MRRTRTTTLTAGVLTAALAASLAAASPVAADPTGPPADDPALAGFHDQEPAWAPCSEEHLRGLECADVEVPLDYSDPGGERITVAISRAEATDPDRRRGILLTNPGGPGGHGRAMPLPLDLETGVGMLGDTRVSEVYDVIGMDPRGSGGSSPRLDCEAEPLPVHTRPTDAEFSQTTRAAISYQRACEQNQGHLLPHMTTANTARDMDVIRAALGEEKANYLGYSYGTYLGAVYGSLFPERLDRSVLDSSMHPELTYREAFLWQSRAYSENMERYTAWLAEHDDAFGFGATPDEVYATLDATSERLREEPYRGHPAVEYYDGTMFDYEVGEHSRYQANWNLFAAYHWFLVNDQPMPEEFVGLSLLVPGEYQGATPDLQNAVLCEQEWPRRLSLYRADTRRYREEHPYGTGAYRAVPQPCTFSTLEPAEPPVGLERDGYPEGLVIAGEFDAQTPHEGGAAMAERLDHAFVTVTGDGGHGFYTPFGLDCVAEAVDAYLVEGAAPEDATCQGLPPAEVGAEPLAEAEPEAEELLPLSEALRAGGPGL